MYKNRSRGFTLIELLVVIAIIGILSAVVLASLSTARNKGSDAAIQTDLTSVQNQAELYYGSNSNTYGPTGPTTSVCTAARTDMFADSNVARQIAGAKSTGSATQWCNTTAQAYAAEAQLLSDPTKYWCVDSTGISKQVTSQLGTNTACGS